MVNNQLTDRERETLEYLRRGLTNEEIAAQMGISPDGVKYHVSQILSKLGVSSRHEAALIGREPEAAGERRGLFGIGILRLLVGGVATVAVVAVAALALGVALSGGGGESDDSESDLADSVVDALSTPANRAPRIGDHWHATYTFYACGEKQPNASTWESGIHTHGDGVIHIHPFRAFEEGAGASLVKWFEYGSGKLDEDEVRLPGFRETWQNGQVCPDGMPDAGREGTVQVFVNGDKLFDYLDYIPQDGDRIHLSFGPEEEIVQLRDRLVLDEGPVTRTINLTVDGTEATTAIDPDRLEIAVGETVMITLHNASTEVSHGLRIAGSDNEFQTGDDFVAIPVGSNAAQAELGDLIPPGGEGFVVVRFDEPGQVSFTDPTANHPEVNTFEPEPYFVGTIFVIIPVGGNSAPTAPAP